MDIKAKAMIDCIRMYSVVDVLPDCSGCWRSLHFDRVERKGEITCWTCDYQSLRIRIKPDGEIRVSNSLHKFYHGNNYSDFTYSQILIVLGQIVDLTGVHAKNWHITRLEFGFNIVPTHTIRDILNRCMRLKTKEFDAIRYKSKLIGKKVLFYQFYFKLYDKYEHCKRCDNVVIPDCNSLRVELCYTASTKMPIKCMSELYSEQTYWTIFHGFRETLDRVVFDESDLSVLTGNGEIEFYFAGLNPHYGKELTRRNRNTANSKKRRWNNLVESLPQLGIKDAINTLCVEKFEKLLNS